MRSMKILCLYNNDIALELFAWLSDQGHETTLYSERLNASWCRKRLFDLALSYTYRYIISDDVLGALSYNVVNIHNSFLPFNRGADPNIWSIIDNTPRGVTLHYIDSKLDHGDIIAQELVSKPTGGRSSTLESTYVELDQAAKELFKTAFQYYSYWDDMRKRSDKVGTYHKAYDAKELKDKLDSYDISIQDFKSLTARKQRGGVFLQSKGTLSCYAQYRNRSEVCVA